MVAIPLAPGFRRRASQLRRDLRQLYNGLRGANPPPLIDRGPSPYASPPLRKQPSQQVALATEAAARPLKVVGRIQETRDAVSLLLSADDGTPFDVLPGQFFTVLVAIDGVTYRRAYSACGDHGDRTTIQLTIKRVDGGKVSNYLNDHMAVGDTLRVLGPSGDFVCPPGHDRPRNVALFGGGSGITPLMAIARAVLADEPDSQVTLVYGNRGADDIIFAQALDDLARAHGERFHLRLLLETPPTDWTGGVGRLDLPTATAELDALWDSLATRPTQYFVCGPQPMMEAVRQALIDRDIAPAAILEERFSSPQLRHERSRALSDAPQQASFSIGDAVHPVTVQPGQTLLDAGLAAGVPLKFSCAMGGCGACRVKVRAGDVDMEEPSCLSASEKAAGYTLACVARPCTNVDIEVE